MTAIVTVTASRDAIARRTRPAPRPPRDKDATTAKRGAIAARCAARAQRDTQREQNRERDQQREAERQEQRERNRERQREQQAAANASAVPRLWPAAAAPPASAPNRLRGSG